MSIARLFGKPAMMTLTVLLASPLVSLAQPPAAATSVGGQPAIAVNYSDLDLTQPAGLEVLFKRLKNAAKTICAQFDGKDLAQRRVVDFCVDHAVAGAVMQSKLPALAALYTAKTGNKLALDSLMTARR